MALFASALNTVLKNSEVEHSFALHLTLFAHKHVIDALPPPLNLVSGLYKATSFGIRLAISRAGNLFSSKGQSSPRECPRYSTATVDIGYDGPISIEWEDAGMDRLVGAPEALQFVRTLCHLQWLHSGSLQACVEIRLHEIWKV